MSLEVPGNRGGVRRRAGRPRKPEHERTSHARRPVLDGRFPVHIALTILPTVEDLRRGRCYRVLRRCFAMGKDRFGFRLAHFAVQGHRVQLVCEAPDSASLSRGLQGLAIRIARNLNRKLGRRGRLFVERYRERILRSRADVRQALSLVYKHSGFSSAQFVDGRPMEEPSPVLEARTQLLRTTWRRGWPPGSSSPPFATRSSASLSASGSVPIRSP